MVRVCLAMTNMNWRFSVGVCVDERIDLGGNVRECASGAAKNLLMYETVLPGRE